MLHIHLLDPMGRPRLVLNQPEIVSHPSSIAAWLEVFSAVGSCHEGETIEVRFRMARGPMATALLNGKSRRMEILDDGGLAIFLTAEDIIPDSLHILD